MKKFFKLARLIYVIAKVVAALEKVVSLALDIVDKAANCSQVKCAFQLRLQV